jgi:hypothetical protein
MEDRAMTEQKSRDKNLQNVVKDLDTTGVNAHSSQQLQQDVNDRRHQDARNRDKTTENREVNT